ncbi:hypothetical protein M2351_001162 [Azospirillum canadense]|nr:hypothetical protein [Azospirillum canadense]
MEADPKHANNLSNYAGLLFTRGMINEGEERLVQCEGVATDPALLLECRFYRLCHLARSDDERATALSVIRRDIDAGVRSLSFDLSGNVARAVNDGHPWPALLDCLAKVIAKRADAAELESFPEWRVAEQP